MAQYPCPPSVARSRACLPRCRPAKHATSAAAAAAIPIEPAAAAEAEPSCGRGMRRGEGGCSVPSSDGMKADPWEHTCCSISRRQSAPILLSLCWCVCNKAPWLAVTNHSMRLAQRKRWREGRHWIGVPLPTGDTSALIHRFLPRHCPLAPGMEWPSPACHPIMSRSCSNREAQPTY